MDRGIVGGSLKDQTVQLDALGRLALRVLSGESAARHPGLITESERQGGGLATTAALEYQRVQSAARHASALQGTVRLGPLQDLYPRRSGAAARANLPHRWPAAAATDATAGRGARACAAEEALREQLRAHPRSRARGCSRPRTPNVLASPANCTTTSASRSPLLSIDLELLLGAVQPDTEPLAGEALNRAQDLARSVHDLSHRLHPTKLRLIGLVARASGAPARAFPVRHDDHVHPRGGAGESAPRSDLVCVPRRAGGGAERIETRQSSDGDRRASWWIERPRAHGFG